MVTDKDAEVIEGIKNIITEARDRTLARLNNEDKVRDTICGEACHKQNLDCYEGHEYDCAKFQEALREII